MLQDKDKLTGTIRIDLIPGIPTEPVPSGHKRVVIAPPSRKPRPLQIRSASPGGHSRYQELLHGIYDAVLIADLSGRIVEVNERASDFFAYPRDEFRQLAVSDVVSGADGAIIHDLNRNLDGERHTLIQAHCVRRDGSVFPAEIAVNRLGLGEPRLAFFVRDITLRRQAEEMLRTEHNAIQNSGSGVAVADLDARLEYVNPAMAGMWGYDTPEKLLGQDARDLFADRAAADAMMSAVAQGRDTWSGELIAKRRAGGGFDVQVSAARNRNADGEAVGVVFSFVDVSDRKRAEAALREAERHRVMLESLGAACHHVGQPATVLMGNLEMMRKQLAQADPSVRQLVESSIENVRKLGEILQRLQAVTEYRTAKYADSPDGAEDAGGSRILRI